MAGKRKNKNIVTTALAQSGFDDVVAMINAARIRAAQTVNTVIIDLYWNIGEHLSRKIRSDGWGKGIVQELSGYIQQRQPGVRGFSAPNLWHMRQFYET